MALAWNSSATTQNSDIVAIEFEDIAIPNGWDLLKPAENLLAIHGRNAGATSSDFLISVSLVPGQGAPTSGGDISSLAAEYTDPVHLTHSVRGKARTRSGSTWSALNEATYAIGPVAENLRISEIMYHPADSDALSQKEAWRPSADTGGSPAFADTEEAGADR